MPGLFYHVNAPTTCPHGGQGSTISSNSRVLVSAQPVATLNDATTIAACPFQVPIPGGTKPQPCVTVKWLTPAARVKVNGQPALLQNSTGVCRSAEQIPQGAPTMTTQTRAIAS